MAAVLIPLHHVVKVRQRPDVALPGALCQILRLGDVVDDVAFRSAQRLHGDGQPVLRGHAPRQGEIIRKIAIGLRRRHALGHAARPAAAEHRNAHAQLLCAGKRPGKIVLHALAGALGAAERVFGGDHAVHGLHGQRGGLDLIPQRGIIRVGELCDLRHAQLHIVIADFLHHGGMINGCADTQTDHGRTSFMENDG